MSSQRTNLPDSTSARWVRNANDERAVAVGCTFREAKAAAVIDFFATILKHSKGEWAGKPFELLPWQRDDIIYPLFGWERPDGTRRFRRAGVWVPKKNGKSTISAGVALYLLMEEPGAEVYSAAADSDQASIVFRQAMDMVDSSPALKKRIAVNRTIKRLVWHERRAWYQVLSAETRKHEGLNIHGLIFDELHAQKTRDLWDTLTYGGAARRQPLLLSISTAGSDRESIGYEQYTYAKRVLDGTIEDPWFFGYVAEATTDEDWKDPVVWRKANPSLGVTIKEEELAEACQEAQNSPAKENSFRRYRLNQWTDAFTRWLPSEAWDRCKATLPDDLDGRECFAGLDLSSTRDTTALVLDFPLSDGWHVIMPFFWIPEEAMRDRERKNKTLMDEWARRGYIVKTPGNCIDYSVVRAKINELGKRYNIRKLATDPWNAQAVATQLHEDGFDVVAFRQGFATMNEPAKFLESLVLDRKLIHDGNPVLTWMVGNCECETDASDNYKPSKKKSTEKIDGVVAMIEAVAMAKQFGGLDDWYTPGMLRD